MTSRRVPPMGTTRTTPTISRVTRPWTRASPRRRRRASYSGVLGPMNRSRWSLIVGLLVLLTATSGAAQTPATPFQVGDRILLHVQGDSALSDTFTVVAGPALRLPAIGEISLAGVRRSDLEAHLTRELGRFLKDPVVQARALIRVSVLGEVVRPGYYAVPVDL